MDIEGNNKVDGDLIEQAKEIVNIKENSPSIANYSSSHSSTDNKVINNEVQILIEDDNSNEPL